MTQRVVLQQDVQGTTDVSGGDEAGAGGTVDRIGRVVLLLLALAKELSNVVVEVVEDL